MSANNCTATLSIGGSEFKVPIPSTLNQLHINDLLKIITEKYGEEIKSLLDTSKTDLGVVNITDILNVVGNTKFEDVVNRLERIGRQYVPMRDNLNALLKKLYKVVPYSEQNILWVSQPLLLNGVKVPNVNISNTGDLVIIDSNNINKTYSVFLEYFYAKTINTPDKQQTVYKFLENLFAGFKKSKKYDKLLKKLIEMKNNPAVMFHYITSDSLIINTIDHSGRRREFNRLLKVLSDVKNEEGQRNQWWLTWNGDLATYTNKEGKTFTFNEVEMDTLISENARSKGQELSAEEIRKTKTVLLKGVSQGHPLSYDEIYNLWDEFIKFGCD